MELQTICCSHHFSCGSSMIVSRSPLFVHSSSRNINTWRNQRFQLKDSENFTSFHSHNSAFPVYPTTKIRRKQQGPFYLAFSDVGSNGSLPSYDIAPENVRNVSSSKINYEASVSKPIFESVEPFRGKSGSISFCGLTHQLIEERNLESSPFKDGTGSYAWILGPVALITSLLFPQIILGNIVDVIIKDEILADGILLLISEVVFYVGLLIFFIVTNHVQKPYLQYSSKRWGLITGLKGYLSSAFFTMGFKVFTPVLAVYVVWPVIGLPALVAVAPFLIGCAVQYAFEVFLDKNGSSCWPLVPIIFELYRLYQLTRGAHFIEKIMFSMKGSVATPEMMERSGALLSMLVLFQVLGVICLWSLTTFLLRLFPSRPVAEKY